MTTISSWSQTSICRYETVYLAYWSFWGGTVNHAACVSSLGTNSPTSTKLRKNIPTGLTWEVQIPLHYFFYLGIVFFLATEFKRGP